jgi:hypothetical protein
MYSSPVIGIFGFAGVVLSLVDGVEDAEESVAGTDWSTISVMIVPFRGGVSEVRKSQECLV